MKRSKFIKGYIRPRLKESSLCIGDVFKHRGKNDFFGQVKIINNERILVTYGYMYDGVFTTNLSTHDDTLTFTDIKDLDLTFRVYNEKKQLDKR